jgi:hypothetical protein
MVEMRNFFVYQSMTGARDGVFIYFLEKFHPISRK